MKGGVTPDLPAGFAGVVSRGRRRLRLIWVVASAELVLPMAAGVALAIALLGRWLPWAWSDAAAVALLIVPVVGVVAWAMAKPIAPLVVARALDNATANHDAWSTAMEIDRADPFAARVVQRALDSTPSNLAEALAPRPRWRRWMMVGALVLVVLGLVVVANPQDDRRAEAAERAAAIEQAADEVEAQADALAELPDTDAAVAELRELVEELRDLSDVDDALAALTEAERALADLQGADQLAQRAAVDGLERTLDASPFTTSGGESAAAQLAAEPRLW